ncbi:unnamed protein product [Prorocentrum cordatum]|uniref:Uncharacterized protein n=1 Tax=Prorocentrum cordatum TaxID=2364126 RepID=A0ABN9QUD7_9DINO|nr:unnamed protein product [Polarella glacialis]
MRPAAAAVTAAAAAGCLALAASAVLLARARLLRRRPAALLGLLEGQRTHRREELQALLALLGEDGDSTLSLKQKLLAAWCYPSISDMRNAFKLVLKLRR